eukprot:CAMPEP_0176141252 /NCGR_PEP_ID=MMETSP0120_2-20121206/71823_1 /TAXON_ID=160619 /ORGANISM="Kryptoperidinium foliaceum, Strain CCMP 1326" /LENGTH=541 /DNA_ID=CAMNT_0017477379 /DNA_START=88 /DNA_END=1714 /DNA_ORIENTATION=-
MSNQQPVNHTENGRPDPSLATSGMSPALNGQGANRQLIGAYETPATNRGQAHRTGMIADPSAAYPGGPHAATSGHLYFLAPYNSQDTMPHHPHPPVLSPPPNQVYGYQNPQVTSPSPRHPHPPMASPPSQTHPSTTPSTAITLESAARDKVLSLVGPVPPVAKTPFEFVASVNEEAGKAFKILEDANEMGKLTKHLLVGNEETRWDLVQLSRGCKLFRENAHETMATMESFRGQVAKCSAILDDCRRKKRLEVAGDMDEEKKNSDNDFRKKFDDAAVEFKRKKVALKNDKKCVLDDIAARGDRKFAAIDKSYQEQQEYLKELNAAARKQEKNVARAFSLAESLETGGAFSLAESLETFLKLEKYATRHDAPQDMWNPFYLQLSFARSKLDIHYLDEPKTMAEFLRLPSLSAITLLSKDQALVRVQFLASIHYERSAAYKKAIAFYASLGVIMEEQFLNMAIVVTEQHTGSSLQALLAIYLMKVPEEYNNTAVYVASTQEGQSCWVPREEAHAALQARAPTAAVPGPVGGPQDNSLAQKMEF